MDASNRRAGQWKYRGGIRCWHCEGGRTQQPNDERAYREYTFVNERIFPTDRIRWFVGECPYCRGDGVLDSTFCNGCGAHLTVEEIRDGDMENDAYLCTPCYWEEQEYDREREAGDLRGEEEV